MESNNLFNTDQSGFRKNRSTIDHILRIQNDITNSIHQKKLTIGIFLDFKKAFDLLWKDGLLIKLKQLGIQGKMYRWIEGFLSNRTIQVKVENALSSKYTLENGTPQGSVISPLLFLIMINDLPNMKKGTEKAIYADDCALWKSGQDLDKIIFEIQIDLNTIQTWCHKWDFVL